MTFLIIQCLYLELEHMTFFQGFTLQIFIFSFFNFDF